MTRPLVLGIAGGTGSGKTTVARAIVEGVGESRIAYLAHDAYYRDLSHLSLDQRRQVNFDHPDAYETSLLIEHVASLLEGRGIEMPEYSYTDSVRLPRTIAVKPRPLVIVEGILVLENSRLRSKLDVKIFVDTDDDIRLLRRVRRDSMERGRTLEAILGQYEATVRPMHLVFVDPSRRHADVIIPRGGRNQVAINMVCDGLRERLNQRAMGK